MHAQRPLTMLLHALTSMQRRCKPNPTGPTAPPRSRDKQAQSGGQAAGQPRLAARKAQQVRQHLAQRARRGRLWQRRRRAVGWVFSQHGLAVCWQRCRCCAGRGGHTCGWCCCCSCRCAAAPPPPRCCTRLHEEPLPVPLQQRRGSSATCEDKAPCRHWRRWRAAAAAIQPPPSRDGRCAWHQQACPHRSNAVAGRRLVARRIPHLWTRGGPPAQRACGGGQLAN